MKLIIIDQFSSINEYRIDFWDLHSEKFTNISIEIPKAINGNIVKQAFLDESFEELELNDYDLILIHERDDKNTGYEGTAIKQGKNVIVYSDSFDTIPEYNETRKLLKIKGSILYGKLSNFLESIENGAVLDLRILIHEDDVFENHLEQFRTVLPLKEYWDSIPGLYIKKKELLSHLKI